MVGKTYDEVEVQIKAAFYGDEGKRYSVIEPEQKSSPYKGLFGKFISTFFEELGKGEQKNA